MKKTADAKFTFFHAPGDKVVPNMNLASVRQAWGDEWGSSSAHARYILFDAGVDGHTDVSTQFMLGCMIPEAYKLIKVNWVYEYKGQIVNCSVSKYGGMKSLDSFDLRFGL